MTDSQEEDATGYQGLDHHHSKAATERLFLRTLKPEEIHA